MVRTSPSSNFTSHHTAASYRACFRWSLHTNAWRKEAATLTSTSINLHIKASSVSPERKTAVWFGKSYGIAYGLSTTMEFRAIVRS
ncbi:hypothetical protein E2C01_018931 [Portunus trituberculatus]|uniref:Uncharacterized protein n=1 Tax=Portunus trituberculatus TaxID=210409 RepID=A0A5B7DWL4_PORTR|nr:hypothetical protein [Portunus trituberculatus]